MEQLYALLDLMSDPEANPEALSKAVSMVEAVCYIMEVSASAASAKKYQTGKVDSLFLRTALSGTLTTTPATPR